MIVDIHTHMLDFDKHMGEQVKADMVKAGISQKSWQFTEEEYLKGTEAAERVIVFGLNASKTGWNIDNNTAADFSMRHKEKYIFFASIDPMQSSFFEELKFAHKEMNCKGIKLGPIYQGLHPHDKSYYKIYEYCENNRLPIITHMAATFSSGVPMEYARPIHMDKVSCDFPNLKIVLAHLGHPWIDETLVIIRKQENVFADISALYYRPWQFYNAMLSIVEYGCGKKVLFGSDFPATTTAQSIEGIRNVNDIARKSNLPLIPTDIIEQIINADALKLLGIESD